MNPWPFVAAAYGLTLGVTALVILISWRAMRAAERDTGAQTPKRQRP